MKKELTIDEMMFLLGIYPSLQAAEKFHLFTELVTENFSEIMGSHSLIHSKKRKKLSKEKKASFASFSEKIQVKEEMEKYKEQNVSWIHFFSETYPEPLRQIYAPPVLLFYKGDIQLLERFTWLGVVGSRAYTPYGKQAVEFILTDLLRKQKKDIGIISGLAKGIDTEAHIETLKNDGHTIAVIGTGLDVYYPYNNRPLQKLLSKNQLVLSEYPLQSKPLKYHFPERNRIIAGLSRGVLVIESQKSSGSLITAYNALDEDRDVFAVPGSIFEKNRAGNHRLIQLGAKLTTTGDDILEDWFLI